MGSQSHTLLVGVGFVYRRGFSPKASRPLLCSLGENSFISQYKYMYKYKYWFGVTPVIVQVPVEPGEATSIALCTIKLYRAVSRTLSP